MSTPSKYPESLSLFHITSDYQLTVYYPVHCGRMTEKPTNALRFVSSKYRDSLNPIVT